MLRLSSVLLAGGPGRSLCTPTAHGLSDGPFRRIKFRLHRQQFHRKYRDVLVSADVDGLVSTARELLLCRPVGTGGGNSPLRLSRLPSGDEAVGGERPARLSWEGATFDRAASEGAQECPSRDLSQQALQQGVSKTEGFWQVYGRRAKESLHLMGVADAALIAAAFHAHDRDTALAPAFGAFQDAPKRPAAQRRMRQQRQGQRDVALASGGAVAASTQAARATVDSAAVEAARAAAATTEGLSEGKSLLVLLGVLSSRVRLVEAFPGLLKQLNARLPRVLYQLTGSLARASKSDFVCHAKRDARLLSRDLEGSLPEEASPAVATLYGVPDALRLLRGFMRSAYDAEKLLEVFEPLLTKHAGTFSRSDCALLAKLVDEAESTKFKALRAALSRTARPAIGCLLGEC
ncbi:hypothetical protein cyc_04531 [Cyclospora cayetanensis]|uniref:Uncharacterized protein n=1 Tax=Cyclospora cayetanensis TaxID=88456 RepID=A0A1D3CXK6_9EIME|nr:hypothetical protein cyc_04531 [Cyclospora cayetanensis]